MTAKKVLWQNTHHLSMCQAKSRKKQKLSCTEGYRVTGLPNQFQYEGLVHPITLDLCAARKTIPFFKPPIATVGSSYFFRPKIKSLGFGFNYRVPGLVGWVLKGRENGGMLGGLDMEWVCDFWYFWCWSVDVYCIIFEFFLFEYWMVWAFGLGLGWKVTDSCENWIYYGSQETVVWCQNVLVYSVLDSQLIGTQVKYQVRQYWHWLVDILISNMLFDNFKGL